MSATPPGSTSSMYWRPGHFSEGIISISGEAAFAPRKTKPKPFLPLCKTALRGSPTQLKEPKLEMERRRKGAKLIEYTSSH